MLDTQEGGSRGCEERHFAASCLLSWFNVPNSFYEFWVDILIRLHDLRIVEGTMSICSSAFPRIASVMSCIVQ